MNFQFLVQYTKSWDQKLECSTPTKTSRKLNKLNVMYHLWLQMNELKYKAWIEKIHTNFLNWMTLEVKQNKWGFYCDIKCLFLQFEKNM